MSLRVECRGQLSDVPALSAAVEAFCLAHGVAATTAHKLVLALEELLTNLVLHGTATGPLGPPAADSLPRVTVVVARERDQLVALYEDSGVAFDPLSVPDPELDQPVEARPIGGLGLHLLRNLISEVRYARVNEHNRITLIISI